MVVVLPVPFTPTTRITSGGSVSLAGATAMFKMASSSCLSSRLSSATLPICLRSAWARSFSSTSWVVAVPRSAAMRVASRSSRVSRSISLPKETISSMRSLRLSRVRVTACFIRSKKPGFAACSFSFSLLPNSESTINVCRKFHYTVRAGIPVPIGERAVDG